jgi:hypothetical protein
MPAIFTCNFAALFIAATYYVWRDWYLRRADKKMLRERVTYMLWVAANR